MEENVAMNNVENASVSTSSSNDDMFTMLFKMVFVVLIGGLIVKLFKRVVNWFKENKRLRQEEKDRKDKEKFDELVEKKAQEKLDEILAKQVESKEEPEKKE